jgi:hypothetical protein
MDCNADRQRPKEKAVPKFWSQNQHNDAARQQFRGEVRKARYFFPPKLLESGFKETSFESF